MTIVDFINHNPLFSTAAVASVGGYVMTIGRQAPGKMGSGLMRQVTCAVTITNDDPFYNIFSEWLSKQKYSKNSRHLTVSRGDDFTAKLLFAPAPGQHVFFYHGRLVWMNRYRKNPDAASISRTSVPIKPFESITFTILERNVSVLRDLCMEIFESSIATRNHLTRILGNEYQSWETFAKKNPRSKDSVILPEGMIEDILADIDWFYNNAAWYESTGIPYRRGYMLYGLPGTGKTSLIRAIAAHFKKSIYSLNLTDRNLSDSALIRLLSEIGSEGILLIEDIDALFKERTEKDEPRVTFSGLLNALDGVATREGMVSFITTNHIERLDPALIRPGRCDRKIEFAEADASQLTRLYSRFFPTAAKDDVERFVVENHGRITMATAQEMLLKQTSK